MLRKLALIGSVVAIGFATVGGGTASAAAKVDAHGSMHCAITGKIKIAPALVFGGTSGPATMTAKLSGPSCTGTSGVSSFKGQLVASLPSNDCNVLAGEDFGAGTIQKAKYKGAAKYNPSVPTFTAGGTFTDLDPVTLSLPGNGTFSVPSGSFSGQSPSVTLRIDQVVSTLATNCQPKTKGVKGSGGLKKMSFSTGSSIDIPA